MILNPIFSVTLIMSVSIGLAMLFSSLEWRKNTRFLPGRILAICLMIGALSAVVLRPSFKKEYSNDDIILLTPGYLKNDADSLLKLYPSALLNRTNGAADYPNAELIADRNIADQLSNIRFILGYGIPRTSFDDNTETAFTFLPGEKPNGITGIFFDHVPVANQQATVNGTAQGIKKTKILLNGPAGNEDSLIIESDPSDFTLKFIPKRSGNFTYRIDLKDTTGKLVESNPLPVQVLPEKGLRILILQDYPTAEVRHLKNFLADHYHKITLRYQLSRNVFRFEYANADQRRIERIDNTVLTDFDLLIIDSDALQKLSVMERRQLTQSIRQGLGVVILFNDLPGKTKTIKEFTDIAFVAGRNDTTRAIISGHRNIILRTLGESIRADQQVRKIFTANDGKVYSGVSTHGRGHVGVQLITETYKFLVEGNTDIYSALWSDLLEKTSRSREHPFRIRILSPDPIYINEPFDIEVTSASEPPVLFGDSVSIALTEDVLVDNRWLGKMWFSKPSWHMLTISNDSTNHPVYVHESENWKSLRVSGQRHENNIRQSPSNEKRAATTRIHFEPVSPLIFFAVFLIAGSFLWLSPKL